MQRTVTIGDPIVFVSVDGQTRNALVTATTAGDVAPTSLVVVDEAGQVQHRAAVKHMSVALPGEMFWRLPNEHASTAEREESVALPMGRYAHKDNTPDTDA